jgi:CHAT domain-containing protein/Tfp pilus assembly protein PilF
MNAHRFEESIAPLKKILQIQRDTLGARNPVTARTLNNLATAQGEAGHHVEALMSAREAVRVISGQLPIEDPRVLHCLENLATLYDREGDYAKAAALYERILKAREQSLDPEDSILSRTMNMLAVIYSRMNAFSKAGPLYVKTLALNERINGPRSPETAMSLDNLAAYYVQIGQALRAEPLHMRALRIREEILGPSHPDTAISLDNMGMMYVDLGFFGKAAAAYERALAIEEKVLGPQHAEVAKTLNHLGMLASETGQYRQAFQLHQRALTIAEAKLGRRHPETVDCLLNLASAALLLGNYSTADDLLRQALKSSEAASGQATTQTAAVYNSLGYLYSALNDLQHALESYRRARDIDDKLLGSDHRSAVVTSGNMGVIYGSLGDVKNARLCFERALWLAEKVYGPDHPLTASALNNLGFDSEEADPSKAQQLYTRALDIRERVLGPDHLDVAVCLNNLAGCYHREGDFVRAESLYKRALQIYEKDVGSDHPLTAVVLSNLSLLYCWKHDVAKARELAVRAAESELRAFSNVLSFASEQERLSFHARKDPYCHWAALADATALALAALQHKGAVLESLTEERALMLSAADAGSGAMADRLAEAKQALAARLLSPKAVERDKKRIEQLRSEIQELENALARHFTSFGRTRGILRVSLDEVQGAIPPNAAIVDVVRYRALKSTGEMLPHYGAIVLGPNTDPHWVDLGPAEKIEKEIGLYGKCVRGEADEATLTESLTRLYQEIWSPVEAHLPPGTQQIIFSPDAQFNFISLATLIAPDSRFLSEKYSIRYVSSGRDLLQKTSPVEANTFVIFAAPDFSSNSVTPFMRSPLTARSVGANDLGLLHFTFLPGAASEGRALTLKVKGLQWQTTEYDGAAATESQLRLLKAPRILHFATHGFVLPARSAEATRRVNAPDVISPASAFLENPMRRSGLALSGAQTTLEMWKIGKIPTPANDGILTAEEVSSLKLAGSWLVVLSACDTGSGDARAGEGVMGLRRGFIQAGAQNLLVTLWPISDETTFRIMVDFYEAAFKSRNAPQALADTQRDWLVKLRKERGLLAAVQIAGPFIMSSQGKP